jgi:hypothetical protein
MKYKFSRRQFGRSSGCRAFILALALLPAAIVAAQDADGDEKPKAAAAAADNAAPKGEDPATKIAQLIADPSEDTLVRTLLASNPSTAAELIRAMKIMVDIKRPEVGRLLVKRLTAVKLEPRDMDQLIEQFGSSTFIQFSSVPQLAPEMPKFVAELLSGAAAYREDPERLAKMIGLLRSDNVRARQEAIVQLARAHGAAVAPLLSVLGDPKRADEHAAARTMLVQLGGDAVGPMTPP